MKPIALLIALIPLLFSSCQKEDWCNCLQSEGSTITEARTIPDFSSVEMNRNVDVILVQGTAPAVEVTCGEHLIDGIVTEVRDGMLHIDNINRCNWLRDLNNTFTVKVTCTQLNQITNNGSGNLSCADTIRSPYLSLDNWNGSGSLSLLINCTESHLKIHTGPADILAAGKSGITYVYSAGNGFIKALGLESKYTYVTTKSTADCMVTASLELQVFLMYEGDVFYHGNPPFFYTSITGTGKVIPY